VDQNTKNNKSSVRLLCADGFDEAFLGMCYRFGCAPHAAYDFDECIKILAADMTQEEALEFFDFNVLGAYVGDATPVFIRRCTLEQAAEEEDLMETEEVVSVSADDNTQPCIEKVLPGEPGVTTYTDGKGKKYKLIVNSRGTLTRVKLR